MNATTGPRAWPNTPRRLTTRDWLRHTWRRSSADIRVLWALSRSHSHFPPTTLESTKMRTPVPQQLTAAVGMAK